MYQVLDVTNWIAERPEALGSKEKFWLIPPTGVSFSSRPHLFKLGRPNTGENWAEKACCEFLKALNDPSACVCRFYCKGKIESRRRELLSWKPEGIILSHGRCFESDGGAILRRLFGWVL